MPKTVGNTLVLTLDELIFPNNVISATQAIDAKRPVRVQITGPLGFTLYKQLREEFEKSLLNPAGKPKPGAGDGGRKPKDPDAKKEALKRAKALAAAKEAAKQKALANSRRKKALQEAKNKALAMARAESSSVKSTTGITMKARELEIDKAFAAAEKDANAESNDDKLTQLANDLLSMSEKKVAAGNESSDFKPGFTAMATGIGEVVVTMAICTVVIVGMGLVVLGSVCIYGISAGYRVVAKQTTRGEGGGGGILDFLLNLELVPPQK